MVLSVPIHPVSAEETRVEKACIALAAAAVPVIQGAEISSARIVPLDSAAQRKSPSTMGVEVEVKAVQRTFVFMSNCVIRDGSPNLVPAGVR